MSPRSKQEYLEAIYLRYKKASQKEKTTILDKFCLNCGYHRKHAIRLLTHFKRFTKSKPKKEVNLRSTIILQLSIRSSTSGWQLICHALND